MPDKSIYKENPSIKKPTYWRYAWALPIGVLLIVFDLWITQAGKRELYHTLVSFTALFS